MTLEALDLMILGPAFLAGILVLTTHVPLGQQVLARGIIFLDLALAQIAALGVIVAYSIGWESGGWQVQFIALSAALAGAALLYATEKYWANVQEAIIGCIFVVAASIGIIVLSTNPQGGDQLKDLLAGQILWVSYEQLIPIAIVYIGVLGLWYGLRGENRPLLFYVLFAVTVTTSVQLVGVYLVFASLIIPALAVRLARTHATVKAYIVGVVSYASGLTLSAIFDLPSGAAIVCMLAITGIIVATLIHGSKRSKIRLPTVTP